MIAGIVPALMLTLFQTQGTATTSDVLKISRTTYLDDVLPKYMKERRLADEQIAAYANTLLDGNGFDYSFDACSIVKSNRKPRVIHNEYGELEVYKYSFKRADGRLLITEFLGNPKWGLCSQCQFEIPLLRISKASFVVVVDGQKYLLKRPPKFYTEEIALVDSSLRHVLQTWEVPVDTGPIGISSDGKRVYVELPTENDELRRLVLEVSEDGLRFRTRAQIEKQTQRVIQHPRDPNVSYRTFTSFRVGHRSFILRYDYPCT